MAASGHRRLVQAGVAALLVAPTVLLVAGRGSAGPELGNYNGTVSSTAVHVQAGSSAFPNFATGAIDNHYPLATARLDSSPNAESFSSPLDTGPLGQTIAAAGSQNQPQYADVRCPPQCDDKPVTIGAEPGPFSSSQAADHKALAQAKAGGAAFGGGAPAPPGGGGAPAPPKSDGSSLLPAPSPAASASPAPVAPAAAPASVRAAAPTAAAFPTLDAGRAAALRSALSAWRTRFLTADDARRYAMPAADTPDGVAGDSARSESRLDGSTLVLDGTSSVGQLVLGGGALVLRDVSVHVTVTNDGAPKKTVTVNVGSAEVGGTPVTIGADGVSVNGQAVPGIGGAGAQASAALNQALGQAGIEVRSLAPVQQVTDHQLTLDAVGVLVRLAPASPAPGVPAQFMAMAVGEVFADSLAVPGEANGGELDDGLPGDVGGGTGAVTPSPAETGTTAASPDLSTAAGSVAGAGPAFASDVNPIGSGTSFGSSGSALGSGGSSSSSAGRSSRLASPAAARRVLRPEKPTKLLLLYLLWQSLVIGTVASLYLWRKAAA
ncbi:MAG TPA: hypothetical protein VJ622_20465 [Acidimicrobiia bacterium]|nr:hypothetical protein [Acidimicrobiia bacterium]